jgi:type II secretory pathway pseudopilin PulG
MKRNGFSLTELLLTIGLIFLISGFIVNGIHFVRENAKEARLKDPVVILEKRLQEQRDRKQANNVNTNILSFLIHNPLERY